MERIIRPESYKEKVDTQKLTIILHSPLDRLGKHFPDPNQSLKVQVTKLDFHTPNY